MKVINFFICLLLFASSTYVFSINLTVTPTNETCRGNGALNFTISNSTPGSNIQFIIYKLPNISTPLATVSDLFLLNLTSGNYRVIVKETAGSVVTTDSKDVIIADKIQNLALKVVSLKKACSSNSDITITTTAGTAVSYEIIAGPSTFPLQTSNVFQNLTAGIYKIRVFDACGNGSITTYTVVINPSGITLSNPVYSNSTCNSTTGTQTVTPAAGTEIVYPLTIQYTIHPPNGQPIITTANTITTGGAMSQDISTTFPSFINQNYPFEVAITDGCSSIATNFSFVSDQKITISGSDNPLPCNKHSMTLTTTSFTPPYTLNFTSTPSGSGFDATMFNSVYPGPFTQGISEYGDIANPVPIGNYTVSITDFCGRTNSGTIKIVDIPPVQKRSSYSDGCLTYTGGVIISIPNYIIVTAIIMNGPTGYVPQPNDVSVYINSGVLHVKHLPIGTYTLQLTDDCNDILPTIDVTVPDYTDKGLLKEVRNGCDLGTAGLKIFSGNSPLTAIDIISAPAGFPFPYNGIPNVKSGVFYMNNLPSGIYKIKASDTCQFTNTIDVIIDGYSVSKNEVKKTDNCGSFDLKLDFVSTASTNNETFWLQRLLNNSTNEWGNPDLSITINNVYQSGTLPNSSNSYPLNNNATNLNILFNGTFRIVRNFLSFNNGSDLNNNSVSSIEKNCTEILNGTYTFTQALEISETKTAPCSTTNFDVLVLANGTAPLHYKIIKKDGLIHFFDNGTSNYFVNLDTGQYTFQVEDACGFTKTIIKNVADLVSIVNITPPKDIKSCKSSISNNEVFDLTQQSSTILGGQSTTDYTLTYHYSQNDADTGLNPITNLTNFHPPTNPFPVYAKVIFNQLPNCGKTTSFKIIYGKTPIIALQNSYEICYYLSPLILNASLGNLPTTTYSWNDGVTTSYHSFSNIETTSIDITAINNYTANFSCQYTKNISVTINDSPKISQIEIVDWSVKDNSIKIFTSNTGSFEYSIDGSTYQDSNLFNDLLPGLYTAYVRDKTRCGEEKRQVWILDYPRYFTPNSDSINNFWQIKNANYEPNLTIYIYDRFGKQMAAFQGEDRGWDGNYNGNMMFASDYWFVVTRADGVVYKGHFSLVR